MRELVIIVALVPAAIGFAAGAVTAAVVLLRQEAVDRRAMRRHREARAALRGDAWRVLP